MSSTSEFTFLHARIPDRKSRIGRPAVLKLNPTGLKSTLFSFLSRQKCFLIPRQTISSLSFRRKASQISRENQNEK